jgi:hypothetical protein
MRIRIEYTNGRTETRNCGDYDVDDGVIMIQDNSGVVRSLITCRNIYSIDEIDSNGNLLCEREE